MVSLSFIMMVVPWFMIALVILAVIFVFFSRMFRCALRDLKRLENVSRSPIYSHVTASISGLSTLRAFKKENDFVYRCETRWALMWNTKHKFFKRFMRLYDENSTVFFLFTCSMRWLAVRLDFIAGNFRSFSLNHLIHLIPTLLKVCIMGTTAGLIVSLHGLIPAAFAGLALAYSSQLTGILQNTVRWASETESRFTSVQRMHTYLQVSVTIHDRRGESMSVCPSVRFRHCKVKDLPFSMKIGQHPTGLKRAPFAFRTCACAIGPIYLSCWREWLLKSGRAKR